MRFGNVHLDPFQLGRADAERSVAFLPADMALSDADKRLSGHRVLALYGFFAAAGLAIGFNACSTGISFPSLPT